MWWIGFRDNLRAEYIRAGVSLMPGQEQHLIGFLYLDRALGDLEQRRGLAHKTARYRLQALTVKWPLEGAKGVRAQVLRKMASAGP